jgi:hypothetical protein
LTPRFDPQIDAWLRLLGGQYSEKLLDWMATVADLARPTCAIYLIGRKGAGKSMFAHGLSRLWSSGGPTSALQVLGSNFNGGLVDCPLILADEALPARFGARAMSAEIREIIGSSSRPLLRKFLADARIEGSIRLVLAANHDRLLSEMMRHEDRSAADIEAVAERFLVVRAPPEAASFLLDIGGRQATEGWVDGDGIAKHALWLRRNRAVSTGGRWLVAGELADMSDALAVSGSVSGLVVEWIAKAIADPAKIAPVLGTPPGFVVGDGRILVRAGFVSAYWETYIVGQKTPTTHAIGSALASLATIEGGFGKYRAVKYRDIRPDVIRAWGAESMVIEEEDFDISLRTVLP